MPAATEPAATAAVPILGRHGGRRPFVTICNEGYGHRHGRLADFIGIIIILKNKLNHQNDREYM